ncbi:MAG: formylglycine-generating enzyme family protein [bacterium]|nr:formylglycine-generating enzyme family protein [bacterium]
MPSIRSFVAVAAVVLGCVSGTLADVAMEWITVGNAGNPGDTRYASDGVPSFDGVAYTYNIGKYEVTNSQYAGFLNSVAAVGDPYGLYHPAMGGDFLDVGGISRNGSGTGGDPWAYAARPNRGNRPVNYVDWYDALRFANWMHNGRGNGDTEDGAYDMSLGASVVRKPGALVFLPSEDEWYKAAFHKGGGTNAGYWDYPTQSDTVPTAEAPPGADLANGSANYYSDDFIILPYRTTEVGAYDGKPSDSAYGTFDQAGNLWEWNETDFYGVGVYRAIRGGSFYDEGWLHAASRVITIPTSEIFHIGFRVAQVPEPATLSLLALGALLVTRRRGGPSACIRSHSRAAP